MEMITMPLYPTLAAIVTAIVLIFSVFKAYDEEWGYAALGTILLAVVSTCIYWLAYGLEAYF